MSDGSNWGGTRGGAVVTGAGRGLGLEISRALARQGYAVHATDVDELSAAAVAKGLGEPAFESRLDVADASACVAAARLTAERTGSLTVWVNNAGILPTGHAWDNDEPQRRRAFDVNAHGTINGTLAALEVMRPAGVGHVINIVSLAGLVAAPGETLYSATKHAVLGFSLGTLLDLRREGIRHVHVSALCPDGIWTPMLQEKVDDPEVALSWSGGALLKPEDVASVAVGLLDHPQAVRSVPRRRGALLRILGACPDASARLLPLIMASARRKQRRWALSVER